MKYSITINTNKRKIELLWDKCHDIVYENCWMTVLNTWQKKGFFNLGVETHIYKTHIYKLNERL
jgi:hypothetical protein